MVGGNALHGGHGGEQFLMLIVRLVAIAFVDQLVGGLRRHREGAGPAFVGADAHGAFDRLCRLLRRSPRHAQRRRRRAQQRRRLRQLAARIAAVGEILFEMRHVGLRRHGPVSLRARA